MLISGTMDHGPGRQVCCLNETFGQGRERDQKHCLTNYANRRKMVCQRSLDLLKNNSQKNGDQIQCFKYWPMKNIRINIHLIVNICQGLYIYHSFNFYKDLCN